MAAKVKILNRKGVEKMTLAKTLKEVRKEMQPSDYQKMVDKVVVQIKRYSRSYNISSQIVKEQLVEDLNKLYNF